MDIISENAYEMAVISAIKPKIKKPSAKIMKSDYKILSLNELIAKNFNKNKTTDPTGIFMLCVNGKEHKMTVDAVVIRTLEAVFRTMGRLPEEMRAVCFYQVELINNIASIRTREELTGFLENIKSKEKTVIGIKDTLLRLCGGVR